MATTGTDCVLRSFDEATRRRLPDHVATALVEGVVAVARRTLGTPAAVDHVDDNEPLVDDRRGRTTSIALEAAELLLEGTGPDSVAVTVEAEEGAVDQLGVNVPGLQISGERRPAHAVVRHRCEVEGEATLPYPFAALSVVRRNHGLTVNALTGATVDVDLSVHHHGGRPTDEVLTPDQVLTVGTPAVDQPSLVGDTILRWATP